MEINFAIAGDKPVEVQVHISVEAIGVAAIISYPLRFWSLAVKWAQRSPVWISRFSRWLP